MKFKKIGPVKPKVVLCVRINEKDKRKLKELARKTKTTSSKLVENIIKQYIEQNT